MPKKTNKILSFLICFLLIFQQTGFSQIAGELDISGHLLSLRNSFIRDTFRPFHLRCISYDALSKNFNLLLDKGEFKNPRTADLENETRVLMNYFFIGLALPNESFWVNLRPDSPNNIIDDELAKTDIGMIFLEADLQLKKDTANLTSPQTPEGKEYWDKLYKKAEELYGNENITIPTLTRPWIVPDEIIIRESKDNAYIYKAALKVMLEQDYLKDSATYSFKDERSRALNEYSSQLIRELIIPRLTKEVNSSRRYAPLRQVYYSLILAQWFKQKFPQHESRNLTDLASKEDWDKSTYFQAYKKSFAEGEYNIKEPVYTPTGQVIRNYFSGGVKMLMEPVVLTGPSSPIRDKPYLVSMQADVFGNIAVSSPVNNPAQLDNPIQDQIGISPDIRENTDLLSAGGLSVVPSVGTSSNGASSTQPLKNRLAVFKKDNHPSDWRKFESIIEQRLAGRVDAAKRLVCEVGCGGTQIATNMARAGKIQGLSVIGIDRYEWLTHPRGLWYRDLWMKGNLPAQREQAENLAIVKADERIIAAFPDDFLDDIFLIAPFKSAIRKVFEIKDIDRKLRKGGRIIINTIDDINEWGRWIEKDKFTITETSNSFFYGVDINKTDWESGKVYVISPIAVVKRTVDLSGSREPVVSSFAPAASPLVSNPFPNLRFGDAIPIGNILNIFNNKYLIRKISQGGPVLQPQFFIDFTGSANFSNKEEKKDFASFVKGIAENKSDAKLPLVFKVNNSAYGYGVFFIEGDPNARVFITLNYLDTQYPGTVSNGIEKNFRGRKGIGLEFNRAEDIIRLTINVNELDRDDSLIKVVDDVRQIITFKYGGGMMESLMPVVKYQDKAYETRHIFKGNLSKTGCELLHYGDPQLDQGGWVERIGSSGYFSNYTGRNENTAKIREWPVMYEPLFEIFGISGNERERFKKYVDNKIEAQFAYLVERLKASGINCDEEVLGEFDLMWMKPEKTGDFPAPVLIESSMRLLGYGNFLKTVTIGKKGQANVLPRGEAAVKEFSQLAAIPQKEAKELFLKEGEIESHGYKVIGGLWLFKRAIYKSLKGLIGTGVIGHNPAIYSPVDDGRPWFEFAEQAKIDTHRIANRLLKQGKDRMNILVIGLGTGLDAMAAVYQAKAQGLYVDLDAIDIQEEAVKNSEFNFGLLLKNRLTQLDRKNIRLVTKGKEFDNLTQKYDLILFNSPAEIPRNILEGIRDKLLDSGVALVGNTIESIRYLPKGLESIGSMGTHELRRIFRLVKTDAYFKSMREYVLDQDSGVVASPLEGSKIVDFTWDKNDPVQGDLLLDKVDGRESIVVYYSNKWLQLYLMGPVVESLDFTMNSVSQEVIFLDRKRVEIKFTGKNITNVFSLRFDETKRKLQIKISQELLSQIEQYNLRRKAKLKTKGELPNGLEWEFVADVNSASPLRIAATNFDLNVPAEVRHKALVILQHEEELKEVLGVKSLHSIHCGVAKEEDGSGGFTLQFTGETEAGRRSFYAKLRDSEENHINLLERAKMLWRKDSIVVLEQDPDGDWLKYRVRGDNGEKWVYRRNPTTLEYKMTLQSSMEGISPPSRVIEDSLIILGIDSGKGISLNELPGNEEWLRLFLENEEHFIKEIGRTYATLNKKLRIRQVDINWDHIFITKDKKVYLIDFSTQTLERGLLSHRIPVGLDDDDLFGLTVSLETWLDSYAGLGKVLRQRKIDLNGRLSLYKTWIRDGFNSVVRLSSPITSLDSIFAKDIELKHVSEGKKPVLLKYEGPNRPNSWDYEIYWLGSRVGDIMLVTAPSWHSDKQVLYLQHIKIWPESWQRHGLSTAIVDWLYLTAKNNNLDFAITGDDGYLERAFERAKAKYGELDVSGSSPVGGIDMRHLAKNTVIARESLPGEAATSKELQEIQRLIQAGIIPATNRLEECRGASSAEALLSCIADILRIEEERVTPTEAGLKNLLASL